MGNLIGAITAAGYLGITLVVFAESGLFFGFFLPGDSLLFTAGLLASQGHFNIAVLFLLCFIAAVVGDAVGYAFGKKIGPKIFNRENSFFFHKDHVLRTQEFYEKHGKKTLILARFIPVVRTFAPILAGVGQMEYATFAPYNIFGGLLWTSSLLGLGYVLGNTIPNIDAYLLPIIALIIFLSILPGLIEIVKGYRKEKVIEK